MTKPCSIPHAEDVGPLTLRGPSGPVICQFLGAVLELNTTVVQSDGAMSYRLVESEKTKTDASCGDNSMRETT